MPFQPWTAARAFGPPTRLADGLELESALVGVMCGGQSPPYSGSLSPHQPAPRSGTVRQARRLPHVAAQVGPPLLNFRLRIRLQWFVVYRVFGADLGMQIGRQMRKLWSDKALQAV